MTPTQASPGIARALRSAFVCWALAAACFAVPGASGAVIDFETIPIGTPYGRDGQHSPNDVVLVENDIVMSVHEFFFLNQPVDFQNAVVGGRHANVFPTTPLALNRIGVSFDFTGVTPNTTEVSFEYANLGGSSNFAVNGGGILELNSLALLPPEPGALAADVTAIVVGDAGGGVVTLLGDIDSFLVGGEELYIDNIVAIPEPATLLLLGIGGFLLTHQRRGMPAFRGSEPSSAAI